MYSSWSLDHQQWLWRELLYWFCTQIKITFRAHNFKFPFLSHCFMIKHPSKELLRVMQPIVQFFDHCILFLMLPCWVVSMLHVLFMITWSSAVAVEGTIVPSISQKLLGVCHIKEVYNSTFNIKYKSFLKLNKCMCFAQLPQHAYHPFLNLDSMHKKGQ